MSAEPQTRRGDAPPNAEAHFDVDDAAAWTKALADVFETVGYSVDEVQAVLSSLSPAYDAELYATEAYLEFRCVPVSVATLVGFVIGADAATSSRRTKKRKRG